MSSSPPIARSRARQVGIDLGELPTGEHNAVTDVPGVLVGHVTKWSDAPDDVARTGVTAVLPCPLVEVFAAPPAAGTAVLNGVGELTGSISMTEMGLIDTPILLTGTTSVGRAFDAVVDAMLDAVPGVGEDDVVAPVVGECDDSWLDNIRGRHVSVADCRAAIAAATGGPVAEGVVGAGTGMMTMGHKAGIGTSSRVVVGLGTVGVLVLANFGGRRQLRVGGVPVGRVLDDEARAAGARTRGEAGSCIGIVMTDVPLDARQLSRVARRVGLGLSRVGSTAGHYSGDIFCAVSTTNRQPRFGTGRHPFELLVDDEIDGVFAATVEATEEAVLNALFVADAVVGRDGHTADGLPVDRVLDLVSRP